MKKKTISVIGGGTGTFTVLSGLKKYKDLDLKAIVAVTDSGGSTGHLRDEYGTLPVGDIRQCIAALAESGNGDNILRDLLLYRFDKGNIKGHNFGNLFLTALTEILGSEEKAIQKASEVLKIRGEVIPVTNEDVDLVAEYSDGSVLVGEHYIDEPNGKHDASQKIEELKIQPNAGISERAKIAIAESDIIILGPGDLYTSILPNLIVENVKTELQKTKAKLVYIVNLMTKYGQTSNYSAQDHVNEIEKYSGRKLDFIFINKSELPLEILEKYKQEKAFPVIDDLSNQSKTKIIRANLISQTIVKKNSSDTLKRSLIRHNSKKIASQIYKLANNSLPV